jgi:DNA-binding MarR family transcriptional regulator
MEERGFVERGRDPADRRVVTLRATAGGRETVEEIDQIRRQAMRSILTRLTPDQQRRALHTFRDLRAAAEEVGDIEVHQHKHLSTLASNN